LSCLASLALEQKRAWPVGHSREAWARGGDGAFDLLICDAAYTPRHYAEPGSDNARSGQASNVLAWHDAVRPIHSLRPERVHSCRHTEIVHS
jgi:hypothetical protein